MNKQTVVDFTRDMTAYHQAAGELIRLARQSPAGLTALQALRDARAGRGFIEWEERIDGPALVLVATPCIAMVDLIIDLRHQSHARDIEE